MSEPWERHDVFRSIVYAIATINGSDADEALKRFVAGQERLYGSPEIEDGADG